MFCFAVSPHVITFLPIKDFELDAKKIKVRFSVLFLLDFVLNKLSDQTGNGK